MGVGTVSSPYRLLNFLYLYWHWYWYGCCDHNASGSRNGSRGDTKEGGGSGEDLPSIGRDLLATGQAKITKSVKL